MEKLLIYIKHNFGFLWKVIESINTILINLLYRNKIENTLGKYKSNVPVKGIFYVRHLNKDDLDVLFEMLNKLDKSVLKFFKPHGFDRVTLQNILNNSGFVKLGYFDGSNNKLVGYFILRLFANKKCFSGRLVHPDYQGKGIGKEMVKILHCSAKQIGFNLYSTISKENMASLNSLKVANDFTVEKELANGFILIKFDLNNLEC